MDNPISWLILVAIMIIFLCRFFNKILEDKEERYKEAENFWKNQYK